MLNSTTDRYQQGAIRRVKRAKGLAREFRYYVVESGERVRKVQTFDSAIYKTEKSVRQYLEGFIVKLNEKTEYARSAGVTFNALLDRYIDEEMPARHSTKGSYTSIINVHFHHQQATSPPVGPLSHLRHPPRRSPCLVPKSCPRPGDEGASA